MIITSRRGIKESIEIDDSPDLADRQAELIGHLYD
jgi:hypothetical protein